MQNHETGFYWVRWAHGSMPNTYFVAEITPLRNVVLTGMDAKYSISEFEWIERIEAPKHQKASMTERSE